MNKGVGNTQNQHAGRSHLNRRLVELHEYARREGITPNDVTRCSEIGVVQLRRHKGKTYVVDLPFCSYDNTEQIDTEVAELLGLIQPHSQAASQQQPLPASATTSTKKQISKTFLRAKNVTAKLLHNTRQALIKAQSKTKSAHPKSQKTKNKMQSSAVREPPPIARFEPGSISQLVQEMLNRAEKIKEQDQKAATEAQSAQPIKEVSQSSQRQRCQITDQLFETIHRQLDQIERACPQPSQRSATPPRNSTAKQ